MSRQLDLEQEERVRRRTEKLHKILAFELSGCISHVGGRLTGLTISFKEYEVFCVVKATFEDKQKVCYIAEETLAECLLKLVRSAYRNSLHWKDDKYPKKNV